jgi:hypothetical protein
MLHKYIHFGNGEVKFILPVHLIIKMHMRGGEASEIVVLCSMSW